MYCLNTTDICPWPSPTLKRSTTNSVSTMKPTWCTFHSTLYRIKGLYMFRALLTHPHEALHKRHLVYCVRIRVCQLAVPRLQLIVGSWTAIVAQPTDICTQYAKSRCFSASWGWSCNARNMQRHLILNTIKWNVYHVGFTVLIQFCKTGTAFG
jgi:hypothetical protein